MGMLSPLEKRLHVMIDQARYEKLTAEAERTGRSVADIVRAAIDVHFDEERLQARRAEAGRRLLASQPDPNEPSETWDDMLHVRAQDIEHMAHQ